jgi:hypothetical protein
MNLYIETENGMVKNHPALANNLIQVFGEIPQHWEPFVRVVRPIPTVYQILDGNEATYQRVDGVWTDVWPLRDMTDEEKSAKQQAVKDEWATLDQSENYSTWTFDEATCSFVPPVPRPEPVEGKIVFWSGADNVWKEAPPYPQDGKQYQFDFLTWTWNEVNE